MSASHRAAPWRGRGAGLTWAPRPAPGREAGQQGGPGEADGEVLRGPAWRGGPVDGQACPPAGHPEASGPDPTLLGPPRSPRASSCSSCLLGPPASLGLLGPQATARRPHFLGPGRGSARRPRAPALPRQPESLRAAASPEANPRYLSSVRALTRRGRADATQEPVVELNRANQVPRNKRQSSV